MIFAEPIAFQEAIDSRRAKQLLPTDLSSEELAALPPEVLEWASFSAGTMKADLLAKYDDLTSRIAGGATPEDFARRSAAHAAGRTDGPLLLDRAAARVEIKKYLDQIDYQPTPGTEGTIQDHRSDARINLKLRTDVEMAQGLGQYTAGQTPATLDLIPCQELVRVARRRVPRNWPQRWKAAGGRFYGHGRMIAAKDDPIWAKISRFGLPYAPFDFNSGMGLRGVRRAEAVALGVIPEDYVPEPQPRKLTDGLQAVATHYHQALQDALKATGYVIRDGILTANYRADQQREPKGTPGGGRFAKEGHFSGVDNLGGSPAETAHLSDRRAKAVEEHLAKTFAAGVSPDAALAKWHADMAVAKPRDARTLISDMQGFSSETEKRQVRQQIQRVLNVLPPEMAARIKPFVVKKGKPNTSGHYNFTGREMEIGGRHFGKPTFEMHVFHETLHAVHLAAPDSYKATLARHFRVRTAGESDVTVDGGGAVGREDKWLRNPETGSAYAGRIYRPHEQLGAGIELPTEYGMLMSRGVNAAHAVATDPKTLAKVLSIFYYGRRIPK